MIQNPSAASVHLALAVLKAAERGEIVNGDYRAKAHWTLKAALENENWTGATADCPPFGFENSIVPADRKTLDESRAFLDATKGD